MSDLFEPATLYAMTGALLLALGLYGFITRATLIRKLIAFNVAGSGIFLLFGATTTYDGSIDPVPQALIITSLVVAVAVTAFGVMLTVRLAGAGQEEDARESEE